MQSSSLTYGSVFHGTKIAPQKWFLKIIFITNVKKSLSSLQLARDLDLHLNMAWYIMARIQSEIVKKGRVLPQCIIEANETYIGSKSRKPNKHVDHEPTKSGRGAEKDIIIGAVQQNGIVVAQLALKLIEHCILNFIRSVTNLKDSELITDKFRAKV